MVEIKVEPTSEDEARAVLCVGIKRVVIASGPTNKLQDAVAHKLSSVLAAAFPEVGAGQKSNDEQ